MSDKEKELNDLIDRLFLINGNARIILWVDGKDKNILVEWARPLEGSKPGQENWAKTTWEFLMETSAKTWTKALEKLSGK